MTKKDTETTSKKKSKSKEPTAEPKQTNNDDVIDTDSIVIQTTGRHVSSAKKESLENLKKIQKNESEQRNSQTVSTTVTSATVVVASSSTNSNINLVYELEQNKVLAKRCDDLKLIIKDRDDKISQFQEEHFSLNEYINQLEVELLRHKDLFNLYEQKISSLEERNKNRDSLLDLMEVDLDSDLPSVSTDLIKAIKDVKKGVSESLKLHLSEFYKKLNPIMIQSANLQHISARPSLISNSSINASSRQRRSIDQSLRSSLSEDSLVKATLSPESKKILARNKNTNNSINDQNDVQQEKAAAVVEDKPETVKSDNTQLEGLNTIVEDSEDENDEEEQEQEQTEYLQEQDGDEEEEEVEDEEEEEEEEEDEEDEDEEIEEEVEEDEEVDEEEDNEEQNVEDECDKNIVIDSTLNPTQREVDEKVESDEEVNECNSNILISETQQDKTPSGQSFQEQTLDDDYFTPKLPKSVKFQYESDDTDEDKDPEFSLKFKKTPLPKHNRKSRDLYNEYDDRPAAFDPEAKPPKHPEARKSILKKPNKSDNDPSSSHASNSIPVIVVSETDSVQREQASTNSNNLLIVNSKPKKSINRKSSINKRQSQVFGLGGDDSSPLLKPDESKEPIVPTPVNTEKNSKKNSIFKSRKKDKSPEKNEKISDLESYLGEVGDSETNKNKTSKKASASSSKSKKKPPPKLFNDDSFGDDMTSKSKRVKKTQPNIMSDDSSDDDFTIKSKPKKSTKSSKTKKRSIELVYDENEPKSFDEKDKMDGDVLRDKKNESSPSLSSSNSSSNSSNTMSPERNDLLLKKKIRLSPEIFNDDSNQSGALDNSENKQQEGGRRTKKAVSYKEIPLSSKLRRDKDNNIIIIERFTHKTKSKDKENSKPG